MDPGVSQIVFIEYCHDIQPQGIAPFRSLIPLPAKSSATLIFNLGILARFPYHLYIGENLENQMIIYPAIDILGGKCVRLRQGDYDEVVEYSDDPVEMAYRWVDEGAQALHLVDLDGARAGITINNDIIEKIAKTCGAPVQVGGGIRTVEAAATYLDLGVEKVIFGTVSIENPLIVMAAASQFPGRVMVGLDIKSGKPATKGWLETADLNPIDLGKRFSEMGVAGIIYTDISRDGMLIGANVEGVRHFANNVDLPVIVSGGVTSLDDVIAVKKLAEYGVIGMIIGKALYDGALSLKEALVLVR